MENKFNNANTKHMFNTTKENLNDKGKVLLIILIIKMPDLIFNPMASK